MRETGVTIMLMDEGLDTGPMLDKRSLPIGAEDTAGTLFEKLGVLGADLLLQILPRWLAGEITPEPQDPAEATLTHVLSKADGLIDWSQPAPQVERAVRAYNPWPSAYTSWNALTVKVHKAHVLSGGEAEREPLQPGQCFLLEAESIRLRAREHPRLCLWPGGSGARRDTISGKTRSSQPLMSYADTPISRRRYLVLEHLSRLSQPKMQCSTRLTQPKIPKE